MTFRVQRRTLVFGSASRTLTTAGPLLPCDAQRGFPRMNGSRFTGAGRDVSSNVTLGNHDLGVLLRDWTGSGLIAERSDTSEFRDHRHHVEYLEERVPSLHRAVHGMEVLAFENVLLDALLSVTPFSRPSPDPARTVLWPCAIRASSLTQTWGDAEMLAWYDPATELVHAERGSAIGRCRITYALVRFGTAWTATSFQATTSTLNADVPFAGCGSQPWDQKLYFVTQKVPSGADQVADHAFVRIDPADPDRVYARLRGSATPGTYTFRVVVLHHPLLAVQHWSDRDGGGYSALQPGTDQTIPLPAPLTADELDRTSFLGSIGLGSETTDYPQGHWGWEPSPDGTGLLLRRGRGDTIRTASWAFQAVTWPTIVAPARVAQKALSVEAPQRAR